MSFCKVFQVASIACICIATSTDLFAQFGQTGGNTSSFGSNLGATGGTGANAGRGGFGSSGFGNAGGTGFGGGNALGGAGGFGQNNNGFGQNQNGGFGMNNGQNGINGQQNQNFLGRNTNTNQFLGRNIQGQGQGQFGNQLNQNGNRRANNRNGNQANNLNNNMQQMGGNNGRAPQLPAVRPRQTVGFQYTKPPLAAVSTKLETRLTKRPGLKGLNVSVEPTGELVLRGEVASAEEAKLAAIQAGLEPGVQGVRNELTFPAPKVAE